MYSHSSSTKDFIHFCICAGKCLLKTEEQKFYRKFVITLFYKLRTQANENKSDLDEDTWINYMS